VPKNSHGAPNCDITVQLFEALPPRCHRIETHLEKKIIYIYNVHDHVHVIYLSIDLFTRYGNSRIDNNKKTQQHTVIYTRLRGKLSIRENNNKS
jgi:hypothetical protein